MNESGFITLLGILVAVYPLLPKEKKLELKFYLTRFDWLVIIILGLVIHFIIFFDYFKTLDFQTPEFIRDSNLNRDQYVYLVFLILAVYLFIRSKFVSINRFNIKAANLLFEEELNQRKYYEVFNLLKNHFNDLIKIEKNLNLRNKIARYIAPLNPFEIVLDKKNPGFLDRNIPNVLKKLSEFFKSPDQGQQYATNILNRLFSNKEFIEYTALNHPYSALTFFNCSHHRMEAFLSHFFSTLFDHKSSVLYFELSNYSSIGPGRFNIHESNKLLYFLFDDVKVSRKLRIYKPVGDKITELLENDEILIKNYNKPSLKYIKLDQEKCPIVIGTTFFSFMINESMHQGLKDHMWLAYFRTFIKTILENLNPDNDANIEDEYPTPFHYLIYHIFQIMLGWYDDYEHVIDKDIILYEKECLSPEGRSIVKSNLLTLGNITYLTMSNNKLSYEFKVYIFEIIMRRIDKKSTHTDYLKINDLLLMSIINDGANNRKDSDYIALLKDILCESDFYGLSSAESLQNLLT